MAWREETTRAFSEPSTPAYTTNSIHYSYGLFDTKPFPSYQLAIDPPWSGSLVITDLQLAVCRVHLPETMELTSSTIITHRNVETVYLYPKLGIFSNCSVSPLLPNGLFAGRGELHRRRYSHHRASRDHLYLALDLGKRIFRSVLHHRHRVLGKRSAYPLSKGQKFHRGLRVHDCHAGNNPLHTLSARGAKPDRCASTGALRDVEHAGRFSLLCARLLGGRRLSGAIARSGRRSQRSPSVHCLRRCLSLQQQRHHDLTGLRDQHGSFLVLPVRLSLRRLVLR